MTPTQQIIPAPRSPEGRNSGRTSSIECRVPMGRIDPSLKLGELLCFASPPS